ncbi:hypothetical protein ABD76_02890 [Paenibacillus dendritiformis]|nr:hypothetical protein [Paenibacillus dendritiformis]
MPDRSEGGADLASRGIAGAPRWKEGRFEQQKQPFKRAALVWPDEYPGRHIMILFTQKNVADPMIGGFA